MSVEQRGATEAAASLEAIAARLRDLTPITSVVAADVMTFVDDRFASGTDPNGSAWAPLTQSTLRARTEDAAAARTRALRRHARAADAARGEMRLVSSRDEDGVMVHSMRLVRTRRTTERLESEFGHLVSPAGVTILVDTNRLRGSIFGRGERTGLRFGTNVGYAAPHQLGTRRMPKRAFLPVDSTGSAFTLSTGGLAGEFWRAARERIRRFIRTGEVT